MGSRVFDPERPVPGLIVRASAAADPAGMAPHLRREDRMEVTAASGLTPVQALGLGYAMSRPCYTVEYEGRPAAMFGVVPSQEVEFPRLGAVWLLGTDSILVFNRAFLRLSHEWLRRATLDYDLVGNTVDVRNTAHIRWLRWLDFTFLRRIERFGPSGLPFMEFIKITPGEDDPCVPLL